MTEEQRSLEELTAHFAQGSPALAAMGWVNEFLSSGLGAVWVRTDPDLRLAISQTFIMANQAHPEIAGRDRDRLADRIVHADRSDGWTVGVLDHLDDEFRKGMPTWFLEGRCGVPPQPGPLMPGYELILFLETNGGGLRMDRSGWIRAQKLLMHHTRDGWLVASFGEDVPTPGWPPR
jgi:hypothetical protein